MKRTLRIAALILVATQLVTTVCGQGISDRTFKYLTRINKMIEDEAYQEAYDTCLKIREYSMSDYDRSVIMNTEGNVLLSLERYQDAANVFIEVIEADELSDELIQNLKLNVGQIMISVENYEDGVKYLEWWLEAESEPSPEVLITIGSAWTQMGNYDKGLVYVERAIRDSDKKPEKSWLDLWLAIYFQKEDYDSCIEVLKEALVYYPDEKKYWSQLSGMHLQKEDDAGALASMRLAYVEGHLTKEKDLLQLVKLFYFLDIPYNGAEILRDNLNKGLISENEENYKLLAEGWLRSKEYDQALEAYKKADRYARTGEYDLYRAQIYMDSEDWVEASSALESAIQKGLPDEGMGLMMLVLVYYEQNLFDDALRSVKKAKDFPKYTKRAEEWEAYLEEEKIAYEYRTGGDENQS